MLEISLSRMLYPARDTLCSMGTLAERVTEAVEAANDHGFTVADIAAACGISSQAVYQWMDGRTKSIDGDNLAELAEMSGFRAIWIAKERSPKCDTKAIQQALKLLRKMTPARQSDAVKIIAPLVEQDGDDARTGTN